MSNKQQKENFDLGNGLSGSVKISDTGFDSLRLAMELPSSAARQHPRYGELLSK